METKLTPHVDGIEVAARLPLPPCKSVTLRADTAGEIFLERLHKIISQVPGWSFRNWHSHYLGPGKSLVLSYVGSAAEGVEDLLVELHGAPDSNVVVLFFKAHAWADKTLSYEAYVEAAGYFKSALRLYNRAHNTKLRLAIPSPAALEPRLSLKACVHFDWFGQEARERPYNPTTWRRLYTFLLYVHRRKVQLATDDFCRLLTLYGVDDAAIEMYGTFYMRACEMSDFVHRKPWDLCPTSDVWDKWCSILNERRALKKRGRRITPRYCQVAASDGVVLKDLVLRSLQDSPSAFSASVAEVEPIASDLARRNSGMEGMGVLAFDRDRPIGFCLATYNQDDESEIHVSNIWVDKTVRRYGVGRDMLRAIKAAAFDRKAVRLTAWVRADNSAAIRLCKDEGFEETGERTAWRNQPDIDGVELAWKVSPEIV